MNFRIISIIIKREYLNKVKKKSFLITTFVVPILFAGLCILPSVIMFAAKEEAKKIAVVDKSGIVMPYMTNTDTATYEDCSASDLEDIKNRMSELGVDAVLYVSELDTVAKTVTAATYSEKPLGMDMSEGMSGRINDAIENYRIESYGIDNLKSIMKDVRSNVHVANYTIDAAGKETISESSVYMIVSMVLGMIVYMFVAMFGAMVMSSVIEEKSSRVVEVLVSSVKATELMFGKIIGVALVAVTQFVLWIVLAFAAISVAGSFLNVDVAALASDPAVAQMAGTAGADLAEVAPSELSMMLSTLANLNIPGIIAAFFVFFIFGYLLYASLFAAIGSAVENEGDSNQLQMPLTIPLILGFFLAFYAFKAPDSSIVFWGSMIPFTSPIVMLARIPFGVPAWEIALSIVLLVATFVGAAYVSAKIYKVGILMFGKKSTFKDLWKWFRMK